MQNFIANYGYLAVFLLMMAEAACIPIPSELIMLLGGALAAGAVAGAHLNIVLVIICGIAGDVTGGFIAWAVGKYAGQAAIRRWGKYVFLREDDIARAERWFEKHGAPSVFFGRMVPVVRTFISLPAGLAGMRPLKFGVYTVAGCVPWTTALGIVGYFIGANWEKVAKAFNGPTYILAGIIAVLLVIAAIFFLRKRRAEQRAEAAKLADLADPAAVTTRIPVVDSARTDRRH
jgi:membrane protein DedA with SNARE-associated domain